ncbi:MAG: S9 family peptidase [Planctomycetes bacterium]|nr:S9 family peptidase [Planctomycetota bacterium]
MAPSNLRSPFVFVFAAALAAQEQPANAPGRQGRAVGLTVEQALTLRTVTNPQLGADFVAFSLVVPRPIADGPGGAYLHLGVIDGLSKLTAESVAKEKPNVTWLVAGKDTAPAMAVRPGTREVSFVRAQDGVPQVLVMPIDGGDATPFAKTPAVNAYRWRPDGKAIAFTSLDSMPDERAAARKRGLQPVVVDEDWRHLSLWIAEEGKEPRKVTNDVTVFDHQWSPDGTKIACAVAPKNTVDDSYMFTRLKVLDVAGGALTKLVDNPGKLGPFAWSPDGKMLAYVTAADRNDPHAGQVWFADVQAGQSSRTRVRSMRPSSVADVQWPAEKMLCLDHMGVRSALGATATSGSVADSSAFVLPRRAEGPDAPILSTLLGSAFAPERGQIMAFAENGTARVVAMGLPAQPPELFLVAPVPGVDLTQAIRLTDSNPQLASVALGEQTIETIRARDGVEFEGILIKPVGYQPGTKYPFVIVVHGGPEAHFSDGWLTNYSNWGQLLAARGYASWYPNYRSSTGYGTAFAKHDHGDPMGKEFSDHLDAIAHFSKAGLIDDTRVGIGGGSYGGYTAAWAATKHSEHFAAAVSFVPFVDLRTKWLTSDIPYEFYYVHYQEQWPWQQPGLMADRSPLSWVTSCRTPLLVLGGTADPRVHPSQPFMLYRAVKFATDTPVRYVQYPGEGHGNRTSGYQLDYALRTLQWFDHYLKGDGERRKKPLPPMDLDYPK